MYPSPIIVNSFQTGEIFHKITDETTISIDGIVTYKGDHGTRKYNLVIRFLLETADKLTNKSTTKIVDIDLSEKIHVNTTHHRSIKIDYSFKPKDYISNYSDVVVLFVLRQVGGNSENINFQLQYSIY